MHKNAISNELRKNLEECKIETSNLGVFSYFHAT